MGALGVYFFKIDYVCAAEFIFTFCILLLKYNLCLLGQKQYIFNSDLDVIHLTHSKLTILFYIRLLLLEYLTFHATLKYWRHGQKAYQEGCESEKKHQK